VLALAFMVLGWGEVFGAWSLEAMMAGLVVLCGIAVFILLLRRQRAVSGIYAAMLGIGFVALSLAVFSSSWVQLPAGFVCLFIATVLYAMEPRGANYAR